jgi:hypothetical protein
MADGQGEAARGTSGQARLPLQGTSGQVTLKIMDKWDIGAMSNEKT